MNYDFTKEGIDGVMFKHGLGGYNSVEVDDYLTKLACAAEKQAEEIERLRAIEQEYEKLKADKRLK